MKPAFHRLKFCYTRRRTQRYSFKRRKVFGHRSMPPSDGGIGSKGFCDSSEKEINYKTNNSHAALHGGMSLYKFFIAYHPYLPF